MAKFEIKFTTADYLEEVRWQYNENGVKYLKSDPNRTKHTRMAETYWENNDEENRTAHYEGF